MNERFLDVDGIHTRYYDEGNGECVLLIHGGEPGTSAGADTWRANIPALAQKFRVLAPDRLGAGYTDNPPSEDGYRIGAIYKHLVRFLEVVGVKRATLVGQSRGAFVACCIAMDRPDLAERLVIVNSASMAPAYSAYHIPAKENIRGGPDDVRHDAEWYAVVKSHLTDEWLEPVARMLAQPNRVHAREVMRRIMDVYHVDFDATKAQVLEWLGSGAFVIPSLVIWGIGDPMTKFEDGIEIYQMLLKSGAPARMYCISQCGHGPFDEYPSEFNAVLTNFVETVSSPAQVISTRK